MRLAVLKERAPGETRVAATPETVRKFAAMGLQVAVEAGAGQGSSIQDAQYADAGAEIAPGPAEALAGAGVVLAVQMPGAEQRGQIPRRGFGEMRRHGAAGEGHAEAHRQHALLQHPAEHQPEVEHGGRPPRRDAARVVDAAEHRVFRAGQSLHLGPTEFRLLSTLMEKPGRVWTREQLLDRVWGRDIYVDTRTIDVHVGRLRKALMQNGGDNPVRTVRGAGYSLG